MPYRRTAGTADDLLIQARAMLPHRPSLAEAFYAHENGSLVADIRGDDRRYAGGLIPGAIVLPRNCRVAVYGGDRCRRRSALLGSQYVRWAQPRGCPAWPERDDVGYQDHGRHHEQYIAGRRDGAGRDAEVVTEKRPAQPPCCYAERQAGQEGEPG
jgi:hypothetical protein